ncbi:MAG: hypothetical protein RLY71_1153 [Pseudomonadota bacterium]|jgi:hypothetical protein
MNRPILHRPARAITALLLTGLAHAMLLGQSGRAIDGYGASHPRGAGVHGTPAPILARVLAPPAAALVPARPDTVMSHRGNGRTQIPPARPPLESIESPDAPPTNTSVTEATLYLPSAALDRGALPRSAPDTRRLDDVMLSGLPLRLRICIDAFGHVTQVLPLQAHPDDAAAVTALREMFSATAYVPGRQGGVDVASYIDLDISIGP